MERQTPQDNQVFLLKAKATTSSILMKSARRDFLVWLSRLGAIIFAWKKSKSQGHIFISCGYASRLWNQLLEAFGWQTPLHTNALSFIPSRYLDRLPVQKREESSGFIRAFFWCQWLKRNNRIFNNKSLPSGRFSDDVFLWWHWAGLIVLSFHSHSASLLILSKIGRTFRSPLDLGASPLCIFHFINEISVSYICVCMYKESKMK